MSTASQGTLKADYEMKDLSTFHCSHITGLCHEPVTFAASSTVSLVDPQLYSNAVQVGISEPPFVYGVEAVSERDQGDPGRRVTSRCCA